MKIDTELFRIPEYEKRAESFIDEVTLVKDGIDILSSKHFFFSVEKLYPHIITELYALQKLIDTSNEISLPIRPIEIADRLVRQSACACVVGVYIVIEEQKTPLEKLITKITSVASRYNTVLDSSIHPGTSKEPEYIASMDISPFGELFYTTLNYKFS